MALLVGIDVGTTNWKVIAFNVLGDPICIKKTPAITTTDNEGKEYYDSKLIWASIASITKELINECGNEKILVVSVSSSAESVVPVEENGEVSIPIITWFDTSAREEVDNIIRKISRERIFTITGLEPNPIFPLAKILRIKKIYPEVYKRTKMWLQLADFINFKLSDEFVTDHTLASRTLAYDINQSEWSDEILSEFQLSSDNFPKIKKSGELIGKVSEKAAQETGLLAGTPLVLGGMDHPCATIPTGVFAGKKFLDSSGTAESLILVTEKKGFKGFTYQGQRICDYLDPSKFAIWGGVISSGASVDWGIKRFISNEDWGFKQDKLSFELLSKNLNRTTPGANGVIYLPHLRGSGAPDWNPKARGAFLGLKSTHNNLDMMRALFEGLSFQVRLICEMEESVVGHKVERLCTVGGGARMILWQQIKADITGKIIEIPKFEDATALGAALLGGVGIGIYSNLAEAYKITSQLNRSITPNPKNVEFYNELFNIYREANSSLTYVNSRLDSLFFLKTAKVQS